VRLLKFLICLVSGTIMMTGCTGRHETIPASAVDIVLLLPCYSKEKLAGLQLEIEARGGSGATVGSSGCDYPDIATALREAPHGISRFYLLDQVNQVSGLRIQRDASLIGFGARRSVLEGAAIPGQAVDGVVIIDPGVRVSITGVTIRAGKVVDVPRRGGGVRNSGTLFMEDCAILENQATYGVGVWTDGHLEMRHCVVAGNQSLRRPQSDEYKAVDCGEKGGGIRVAKDGYAMLDSCLIAYNKAGDAGGAIHISCEGTARLVECTLHGNSAKKRGGALDLAGGQIELIRCTITGNSSGGMGQAIFHRGRMSIVDCLLSENGQGKAYYLATDKGGEYGKGIFDLNEGNFDDTGSLPLSATGNSSYIRFHRSSIIKTYGATFRW